MEGGAVDALGRGRELAGRRCAEAGVLGRPRGWRMGAGRGNLREGGVVRGEPGSGAGAKARPPGCSTHRGAEPTGVQSHRGAALTGSPPGCSAHRGAARQAPRRLQAGRRRREVPDELRRAPACWGPPGRAAGTGAAPLCPRAAADSAAPASPLVSRQTRPRHRQHLAAALARHLFALGRPTSRSREREHRKPSSQRRGSSSMKSGVCVRSRMPNGAAWRTFGRIVRRERVCGQLATSAVGSGRHSTGRHAVCL
ncbi:uncharacterized protein LOC117090932 [Trachypithecus francoisi]|uniref:uncharacterized protein LOC117090932 n=1 Tax=Trachypithecus francoisi TaxID=54180 RepID=UPI00141B87F1|nr:uncharacterized protein LOC117090932 [Trachypithecus francoisi]